MRGINGKVEWFYKVIILIKPHNVDCHSNYIIGSTVNLRSDFLSVILKGELAVNIFEPVNGYIINKL